jgi:dihydrodipicolinate synthase/N-acetylneuraminate lyase
VPLESGTIVRLVTPFDARERVDGATIGRLIEFTLREGADALMPTALTGEGRCSRAMKCRGMGGPRCRGRRATPLPLILVNDPSLTGVDLKPDVLAGLAAFSAHLGTYARA